KESAFPTSGATRETASAVPAERAGLRQAWPRFQPQLNAISATDFSQKQNGRADPPAARHSKIPDLLLVDGLFQFGPRRKFRDLAGGDLNGGAGLWIASVARFTRRNGECAEANQGHAVSFAEGGCNALDSGINGGGGLRFADVTRACDLVNQ